jgi:hypothetical protein
VLAREVVEVVLEEEVLVLDTEVLVVVSVAVVEFEAESSVCPQPDIPSKITAAIMDS